MNIPEQSPYSPSCKDDPLIESICYLCLLPWHPARISRDFTDNYTRPTIKNQNRRANH